MVGICVVPTIAFILFFNRMVRNRWRRAAIATGLPLSGRTSIEASVPGGSLRALEDFHLVSSDSDCPHQVRTSVLGVLSVPPPECFVASTHAPLLGGPTFTTGDAEFDATVVVGAKDHDAGRAYLTPRRRTALLRFFAVLPKGTLFEGRITHIRDGRMRAEQLTRTIWLSKTRSKP